MGLLQLTYETQTRYALSFTSGGLLAREGVSIAGRYLESRDWQSTRIQVVEENMLQARTTSSLTRVTRETVQRLATFDDDEIELLVAGSPTEQHHLMWAAACRRYALIGDFAEEVLRERYLVMTPTLETDEFDRFIAGKTLWHPELDGLRPSTRHKLRQTLFRMLREADLRSSTGEIIPAVISERVSDVLCRHTDNDLRFFPTASSLVFSGNQVQR